MQKNCFVYRVITQFIYTGSSEVFTLDVLVALLKQENAVDVCVIKVPEQIQYAEYFIVASGLSTRHLKAMALYAIKVVIWLYCMLTCKM